jgi:hypothetical protein
MLGNCDEKEEICLTKKKQMLATLRGSTGLWWNRLGVALQ